MRILLDFLTLYYIDLALFLIANWRGGDERDVEGFFDLLQIGLPGNLR